MRHLFVLCAAVMVIMTGRTTQKTSLAAFLIFLLSAGFALATSELPIAQGTACSLQEEMLFTKTKEYGWMPELFARFRPELLQAVADWKEPTP